jgi:hypothetical protein
MDSKDLDQLSVVLAHSFGDVNVPLEEWMQVGPGPRRFIHPIKVISEKTGKELPLSVIPLRYRNTVLSRFLIRIGLLDDPWQESC